MRRLSATAVAMFLFVVAVGTATAAAPARTATLANGLDVVMMPDATTPLLSSLLIVRAGSGNETLSTAGATHLLEHMIFRGTESRTQDEIYDAFDRMGAYHNAQTRKTYTNFILVTPVEHARGAMEIQADMILHSVIDPDTLEIEKGRVIAEIEQGRERSSNRADEIHRRHVYEPTSYGFPTTGSVTGIRSLPADSVRSFHDDWYAVNNMALVLRGDLTYDEMKRLADAVYGGEAARALPERPEAWPVGMEDWREGRLHRAYGADGAGSVHVTISAPRYDEADAPAFAALALLLDDELDARLSAENPLVTYVRSGIRYDPAFSVLEISAGLMPGTDPDAVADAMIGAVRSLTPDAVTVDQVKRALRERRRSELFFAEQVQYGSFLLVPKLAVAPWGFWQEFERAQDDLSGADLAAAYSLWLEQPRWVGSAYLPEPEQETGGGVELGEIVADTLDNGLAAVAREVRGAPVAGIFLAVRGRSSLERGDRRGWVDLLHRLLLEGSEQTTAERIERRMNEIGMEMNVVDDPRMPMDDYRTKPEYSYVRVQVVAENWDRALAFLAERLADDGFGEQELEAAVGKLRGVIDRRGGTAKREAQRLFARRLFGDNVNSAPIYGDGSSLDGVTPDALRRFRRDVFSADRLVLSVLAPAPAAQILDLAAREFAAFTSTEGEREYAPASSSPGTDTVRAPGRQAYIATGFLLHEFPLREHAATLIANAIVSDRIYRDLGEKRGWAYGAGSSLLMRDGWGAWTAGISLPEEHLAEAKQAVYRHLASVARGEFDEDRLAIAVNEMRGSMLRRYSSRINLAMAMGDDAVLYGDPGWTWTLYERIGALTLTDVRRVAAEYFSNPEDVVILFGLPEGSDEPRHRMPPGMGGMGGH